MRRLGIHSFVWTGGGTQAMLEEAMENSATCGYGLIEFAYLRPEKFDLDRLARKAQSLGLEIAVTMGLPLSADVSSEDAAVVKAGEELLAGAVAAVRDVGGTKLGGILYSAHTKYSTMPSDRGRKNSVAAIAKTADAARKAGVDLVLEVVNRFETNLLNTAAQGLGFIKATGSDHVTLHLDTFHMNIEEANPAAAIRLAGDKIGYFHIGESNRGYLGDGVIDFDRIFDALLDIGYERDVTFESFSSAVVDEGLSLACAIWRDTWTDNMQLAKHAKAFIDLKMEEAVRRRNDERPFIAWLPYAAVPDLCLKCFRAAASAQLCCGHSAASERLAPQDRGFVGCMFDKIAPVAARVSGVYQMRACGRFSWRIAGSLERPP